MKKILIIIISVVKKTVKFIAKSIEYALIRTIYYQNKMFNHEKKANTKNIMILVSRLCNGGAEKVTADVADELAKKYNLILVTYNEKTEHDYKCNAKRIVIDYNKAKIFKNLSLVKQIIKLKKENSITHTISFCSRMNYLNTMSKVNDTTIISIRNYLSKSEKEKKHKHINKVSAKYSDKIVVVSKELIQDQVENFEADTNKINVIYNFCDEEKIQKSIKKSASIVKEENIVINIGRLSQQKGQIHLIRAFKKVVTEIPNAKLIILGQGELKNKLENEIESLELKQNVFLLGFQKNLYEYLQKASVFVLSSFHEGMSNVILEAMCCGLPVISTDCKSGTREIIAPNTDLEKENTNITKEDYGILVPVVKSKNDEERLSQVIIDVLKDKELREHYAKKSKERIKAFSKEKAMKKWIEVIG